MIRVLIYNENIHEKSEPDVQKVYPNGIHNTLKEKLQCDGLAISTVTLDTIETLTDELLSQTDVMLWWGHAGHHLVPDEIAERVQKAVHKGMGILFLHSAHMSKPFIRLMGTPCTLTWREDGDRELVWVCNPAHPIAQGIGRFIHLEHDETYGEPFAIPEPDELVFIGSFEGGEVFRAGCCYRRGNGRVFYFQPGHETFPIYYHPEILQVLHNAIVWAAPTYRIGELGCPNVSKPLT